MDVGTSNIIFAFILTLFAGLSTGFGSLFALYQKHTSEKFLSGALGFSAGVMIYVSVIEIFPKARESLEVVFGPTKGYWVTTTSFFVGIGIIALIDALVPSKDNPHELCDPQELFCKTSEEKELLRMGFFSALAIAIHNFPEGLATFFSAIEDPNLGISIAIAVAIHNIPEGIAVAVPLYFATNNRKKSALYSFLSGVSEPLGAIIGFLILRNFLNDAVFGTVFAMVAGIMVYISLDELLPTAEKYGEHHIAIRGVIGGMVVMAISLLMLA